MSRTRSARLLARRAYGQESSRLARRPSPAERPAPVNQERRIASIKQSKHECLLANPPMDDAIDPQFPASCDISIFWREPRG
jgi:hypothetical protein